MALFTADTMILLGQVRQIQKLVERPRDRQQLAVTELAKQGHQALARSTFLATIGLGRSPDLFNTLVTILARETLDALAQKLSEQTHIFSEIRMQFSHIEFLLN